MPNRLMDLERDLGAFAVRRQALRTGRQGRAPALRPVRPRGARGPAVFARGLEAIALGGKPGVRSAGSTTAQALAAIAAFRGGTATTPWKLARAEVADRLEKLVGDPDLVSQGALNLCGPAIFFHLWLRRDPLAVATYGAALFESGRAAIGSLQVKASSDLLKQDYAAVRRRLAADCPPADWMMMSALRDSENIAPRFEGTPEEDIAGITRPAELAAWLRATGLYAKVQDEATWHKTRSFSHAKGLAPAAGVDVACLINAHILSQAAIVHGQKKSKGFLESMFPDHFIHLHTPIAAQTGDKLGFTCWTWGDPPVTVSVGAKPFGANYYGAVIATV